MPTKSKAVAKAPVRGKSKTQKPFLRFYHSEELRTRTLTVLRDLEEAEDCTEFRDALADVVAALTDSGMDYFFLRPLKVAHAGFMLEQSAKMGMAGTTTVLGSVIRNVIGRMDPPQLLAVSGYIRQLMK